MKFYRVKFRRLLFWISLVFWFISLVVSTTYLLINPPQPVCYLIETENVEQLICDPKYDINTLVQKIASFVSVSGLFTWIIPLFIKTRLS